MILEEKLAIRARSFRQEKLSMIFSPTWHAMGLGAAEI
jgi:hypothetical protein